MQRRPYPERGRQVKVTDDTFPSFRLLVKNVNTRADLNSLADIV
jgi:hypothetical protein